MVIVIIFMLSIFLGLIKYKSIADQYKGKIWQLKFSEIWNDFINYFISGLIGYYLIFIRLPILRGNSLSINDIVLFVLFILGLFGHLCVMSLNITKGVEAIISRVLERK